MTKDASVAESLKVQRILTQAFANSVHVSCDLQRVGVFAVLADVRLTSLHEFPGLFPKNTDVVFSLDVFVPQIEILLSALIPSKALDLRL